MSKAQPQSKRQVPMGSRQRADTMQRPGNATEAQQPSMPYRSAFMGGHMVGTRR